MKLYTHWVNWAMVRETKSAGIIYGNSYAPRGFQTEMVVMEVFIPVARINAIESRKQLGE